MRRVLVFVLGCGLLWACTSGEVTQAPGPTPTPGETERSGLEERIGQMLLIGFRGLELDPDSTIAADVRDGRVGGIILFSRDVALDSPVRNVESPEQVRRLVSAFHDIAPGPLFVAVDQEGGRVARLGEAHGFPPTLSQQELGARDDPEATRAQALATAELLADLGINLNFAPVVDVNTNLDNPVIGGIGRSFSADPAAVVRHASAVIEAHREHGVITALKHFPGHGSSTGDSHEGFVDVTDTWSEIELVPYRELSAQGLLDTVMTAHIFNAQLDPDRPGTLSPEVLGGLLREHIGFDGVVFSDDMQMGAITDHYGLEDAIRMSLEAGVDVLVFGNNLVYDEDIATRATQIIVGLVRDGTIPEVRIDDAYERIQSLKGRLS